MPPLPAARPLPRLGTSLLAGWLFASTALLPAGAAPASAPQGAPAIAPASTAEALASELTGKTFFLRGFFQDDKLDFATDGTPIGSPQRGSFTLSGVQIDKVKFTKHSMEIEAHRIGLHFFGALPYEDDSKPFEQIAVNPKKTMEIDIERVVIEPEKKKKKKDRGDKEDKADQPGTDQKGGGSTPAPAAQEAPPDAPTAPAARNAAPAAGTAPSAASPAPVASAASAAPAAPSPEHDPRVSFLQLSKAVNVIFAPGLDQSVIATLPRYWQNYFASKEGRDRAERLNASVLRPGGPVRAPRLLTVIDPVSNEYAQRHNIAGMVFLEMVVGSDGRPGDVTIVRPIGFGLDERAVDAVEHAKFSPGTLNGKPVPELINLQVTFRIYSNRTRPTGTPTPTQVAPRSNQATSNAPQLASAAEAP